MTTLNLISYDVIVCLFMYLLPPLMMDLQTIILMKVNPKIHLPQMLINFLIRKMAGVFLYFLERKAVSVRNMMLYLRY